MRLPTFVGVMVTLVWAASNLADIVSPTYDVPVEVHGVMALVAGAFFGKGAYETAKKKAIERHNGGDTHGHDPKAGEA